MRPLEYAEKLAVGFVASGCVLGALLGLVWALGVAKGERRVR